MKQLENVKIVEFNKTNYNLGNKQMKNNSYDGYQIYFIS